jgi:hypothetical protein
MKTIIVLIPDYNNLKYLEEVGTVLTSKKVIKEFVIVDE